MTHITDPKDALLAIAEQFDELCIAARNDGERDRSDVWHEAAGYLRRRAASVGQEDGWREIESAPRNGRAILVMQNNWPGCKNGVAEECNGHNTYVAEFWAEENDGDGEWMCYMSSPCEPVCPIEPTHWMPLPAPPKAELAKPHEELKGEGQ